MIPAGKYNARGSEAALGFTKDGKEQVAVELVITDGDYQGHTITWWGYFTDKTTERTIESLRILGWSGTDMFDLSGIDANDVSIVVEEETGNDGQLRSRVRWINKPGGGLALKERMGPDQAKAFAARMKGAVLAFDKKAGAPKTTGNPNGQRQQQRRQPGPQYEADDSEIPF